MTRNYKIIYDGRFMKACLTLKGAEAEAYELAKAKGWDFNKVKIEELI